MIDLKEIKPKVKGQSDKFSWNLYKFLNKLIKDKSYGKYYQQQLEVHWLHNSRWDGSYEEFNPNKLILNQMLILPLGLENGMSFYSMMSVMQKGNATEFALPRSYELTNITEWFFDTYKKDGRCIFDREHDRWWQGADNRFTYINSTRKCNWCGEWHKKEIHKEVKIKRHEVWI